jgi:hypothetical protein
MFSSIHLYKVLGSLPQVNCLGIYHVLYLLILLRVDCNLWEVMKLSQAEVLIDDSLLRLKFNRVNYLEIDAELGMQSEIL